MVDPETSSGVRVNRLWPLSHRISKTARRDTADKWKTNMGQKSSVNAPKLLLLLLHCLKQLNQCENNVTILKGSYLWIYKDFTLWFAAGLPELYRQFKITLKFLSHPTVEWSSSVAQNHQYLPHGGAKGKVWWSPKFLASCQCEVSIDATGLLRHFGLYQTCGSANRQRYPQNNAASISRKYGTDTIDARRLKLPLCLKKYICLW